MSSTPGISAFPQDGNLLSWTGTIKGPEDTYYSGLTFKLSLEFPSNYPMSPPTVLFTTPMFHPNVDMAGRICLDILKDKWSAVYNVQSILLSLQSLLGEPNKFVLYHSVNVSPSPRINFSRLTNPTVNLLSTAKPQSSGIRIQKSTGVFSRSVTSKLKTKPPSRTPSSIV